MDRNAEDWLNAGCLPRVALRKESVDRNFYPARSKKIGRLVALRKESVDRNVFLTLTVRNVLMSLSARRAWIEILILPGKFV